MNVLLFCVTLKNDVESEKPIIKESAKIDPKIGENTDAKNTSQLSKMLLMITSDHCRRSSCASVAVIV